MDDLFSYAAKQVESQSADKLRMEALCAQLKHYNQLYYSQAVSEISDAEYDTLYRELEDLESKNPQWLAPDSPTQMVGEDSQKGFAKIRHEIPMLSIDDIFEKKDAPDEIKDIELVQFYTGLQKALGKEHVAVTIEPKIDGVAVSITYKNGKLAYAATRGDGRVGDDISNNIKTISCIPHELPEGAPKLLEVRGEIFMKTEAFANMNEERELAGLPCFANPRNASAGSIKLLDPKTVAERPLSFLAHGIGAYEGQDLETTDDFWDLIHQLNIPANDPIIKANSLEEMRQAVRHIDTLRHSMPYGTDGAVVKIVHSNEREQLGFTARAPRWAAAYKFPPEQKETKLLNISIQVGRTGVLTPVAELEPVSLSGSVVSRATLHNQDEIARKDIRIGDTVLVEKAGEIIPAIIRINPQLRPPDSSPYSLHAAVHGVCPACQEPISKWENQIAWRCGNFSCPAQASSRITHFCSRAALNIESLGGSVADSLVAQGIAHSPIDLFSLNVTDLGALNLGTTEEPRILGEKNAQKIISTLEQARHAPLAKWIYGFGIPNVGAVTAQDIAQCHPDLASLAQSPFITTLAQLASLISQWEAAGPQTAENKSKIAKDEIRREECIQNKDALKAQIESISQGYLERGYLTRTDDKQAPATAIGYVAATALYHFLSSHAGSTLLQNLAERGINPLSDNYKERLNGNVEGILAGKIYVLTGSLSAPRPEIAKMIESHGGKTTNSISKNTDYLVAGNDVGASKTSKANALNIPIISEEQLLKQINP